MRNVALSILILLIAAAYANAADGPESPFQRPLCTGSTQPPGVPSHVPREQLSMWTAGEDLRIRWNDHDYQINEVASLVTAVHFMQGLFAPARDNEHPDITRGRAIAVAITRQMLSLAAQHPPLAWPEATDHPVVDAGFILELACDRDTPAWVYGYLMHCLAGTVLQTQPHKMATAHQEGPDTIVAVSALVLLGENPDTGYAWRMPVFASTDNYPPDLSENGPLERTSAILITSSEASQPPTWTFHAPDLEPMRIRSEAPEWREDLARMLASHPDAERIHADELQVWPLAPISALIAVQEAIEKASPQGTRIGLVIETIIAGESIEVRRSILDSVGINHPGVSHREIDPSVSP